MAEFCKQCFIKTLLTPSEKRQYQDGHLKIIETNYEDLCEGCGNITQVVYHIIRGNKNGDNLCFNYIIQEDEKHVV